MENPPKPAGIAKAKTMRNFAQPNVGRRITFQSPTMAAGHWRHLQQTGGDDMKASDKPEISERWWMNEKPSDFKGGKELTKVLADVEKTLDHAKKGDVK